MLQIYRPVGFVPLIGSDPLAGNTGGLVAWDQLVVTGMYILLYICFIYCLFMVYVRRTLRKSCRPLRRSITAGCDLQP
jgi:hypothetical protein